MSTSKPFLLNSDDIEASLYRPYKCWSAPGSSPINVVLIKREDADCIAACPALGLRVDSKDYLEASFELARQVKAKLGISPEALFTSTCIPPFDAETGATDTCGTLAPPMGSNLADSAPDEVDTFNSSAVRSASHEMSEQNEGGDQPDLFG